MLEFRLPDVGEGIAEAELVEWNVAPGDLVREGDALATIETDKAIVEMPCPATGTIRGLGAEAGQTVRVGEVLVVIDDGVPAAPGAPEPPTPTPQDPGSGTVAASDGPRPRPKASPAVRRLAVESGVDLAAVAGSGPGGRVTSDDIQAAAATPRGGGGRLDTARPTEAASAAPPPRPAPASVGADQRLAVRGLRRQVARNMVESWRAVPHIIDWRDADVTGLIEARRCIRDALGASGVAMTYLPLLVKLTATALRRHPLMNASFDEDALEYTLHGRVNVGVAVSVADGLLVPVVKDADQKSVAELHEEIGHLVEGARNRRLRPEQLQGGTYTVNNFGAVGVGAGTPIIRQPEVGILGVGRIADKVVAVDGAPVVRPTVTLSSVGDHRLHDGATLAAFTAEIVALIERPCSLLAELR
jgi:pyruvate dehydrogenase E2 component (dihydrolipoamide acetyltransferase)